jgi:hypothetical protein
VRSFDLPAQGSRTGECDVSIRTSNQLFDQVTAETEFGAGQAL